MKHVHNFRLTNIGWISSVGEHVSKTTLKKIDRSLGSPPSAVTNCCSSHHKLVWLASPTKDLFIENTLYFMLALSGLTATTIGLNTICLVDNKSNNIWPIWSSCMEQFHHLWPDSINTGLKKTSLKLPFTTSFFSSEEDSPVTHPTFSLFSTVCSQLILC